MLLVGKILLGAVGSAVAMGAVISSEGFVNVRVHEKKPDGVHLHIIAPVLLMNVGLHFVPRRNLKEAAEQVRPWLPVIDAAVEELKRGDDVQLVEVSGPDHHVKVATQGGSLIVDVTAPEDDVHVSLPLSEIDHAMHEIAAAGPTL
jgi:hypothetical protein